MYWKTLLETVLNKKILPSLKTTGEFLYFLAKRAKNDTIFRVAASLSYTSLIAIVPLLAIGLAIFSAFPVFSSARVQIEEFLMQNFIPSIEQEISQYLAEFVNAAAQLTTIGVVGLAITAILLLSTIENSLNFIFKVTRPRRFTTKITLYWTVITLGPLLLGATFSLRGYLFTLQKFMPIKSVVEGKSVVLVDDSLVRGTTSSHIIKILKNAGASKVHMRSVSPKILNTCIWGVDIPTKEELICHGISDSEIAKKIGADSVKFLPLDMMKEVFEGDNWCLKCFLEDRE